MKKLLRINAFLFVCLTSGFQINAQCPTTAPTISGPIKVCAGTIVNYNSLSFGVGNLIWSINGGGTFLGPSFNPTNPQVNWTLAGNWQILISTSGCPSTPIGTLNVEVVNSATLPAPTTITGPAGVCNGSTTVYSVPAVAGQTPIWLIRQNFGFPTNPVPILVTSGNQVSINWSIPIQASYTLFASYTNGICSGMQASLIINHSTGTTPITINGNGTDQFCLNQSFNFTAYSDPQDTFTWSLPLGGGTITPSGNSALVQWTSAGTFSVAVSATNPCGAPRNTSRPITVGPAATIAPSAISKQNAITCLNQTERLSVPPVSGATSYKWTIGLPAGNNYYTTSVPYLDQTFSSNASATATVIASNGYCDSPPSPIFSFNIGVAPLQLLLPPSVCVGTEITLTITSAGSMTGYVFAWSVGDGIIIGPADGSSIRVKWNSSGQRFVFAAANTPCGAISAPAPPSFPSPINVQDPSFTMNPITGVSMACLGQYQYYAPVTQIGITPTWALTLQGGGATSGGTISTTLYNTAVTWNTPGNYTLTANATNSCGTSQSQSLNVTVASGPKPTTGLIYAGGAFTRNELVCTSSIPVTRSYSVPLTAGYNYAWEAPLGIVSSTANNASITWNQSGTDRMVKVTPSTANCIGEMEYLYSSVYLSSSVGVLSTSVSTMCSNAISPILLSLSSSTGTVTYQVRKKFDLGAWTNWTSLTSNTYNENLAGYTNYNSVLYLEFQAIVQNASCSAVFSNVVPVTIYISPFITNANSIAYQSVCSGQTATVIPITSIPGATFTWTTTITGSITGAPPSGTGNISHILVNNGNSQGVVVYRVTASINGCSSQPFDFTRYVNPIPVITTSNTASVCSGVNLYIPLSSSVLYNSFRWFANDNPNTTGESTGLQNTPFISNTIVNNTSSPQLVVYTVTPTNDINSGSCVGIPQTITVTVNPKPLMTSPSTTAGCGGLPLSLSLTSNVPSSFLWWATNNFYTTGESLTQKNTSTINDIISLDQGIPQNVTYTVYPTSTIGSCVGATQTVTASIGFNQTITFNPLPAKNYGDPAFSLTATASSGLPVSFASSNTAVATVSGNTVTIVGGGTTTITASQAGNASYCSPPGVVQTLTVNKINQTITFSPLPPKTPSDPAFTLTATASSGLPVSYISSIPAVATISGNMVTLVGTGTTTITASQAGNANYNAATSVGQAQVVKFNQTITFAALPAKTYGDPAFSLTATASSGLPVSYISSNSAVATIAGSTLTIVGGGTATIIASQGGDVNYFAASAVPQTLTVNKLNQTITFAVLPTKTYGDIAFSLTAAASSGLAVTTFTSSSSSVATISGSTVTISGSGSSVITALQAGNSNYNPATGVTQPLIVNKASLSASADNKSRTYGGANPAFTVSYSGFVNGENSSVIDIPSTASTSAIASSNVGSYSIIPAGGTDNNYTIGSYNNGTLTISKASLTATANNQSRYYGNSNPTLTFYYTGFIGSDGASIIDSPPIAGTAAVATSPVGSYPIILSGGSDNNYSLSLVNGTLTVLSPPPPPPPPCSIKITKTGDLCVNGRVKLAASVVSGGTVSSRQWSDGSSSSYIWVYDEGSYDVTYYFTSGCSSTTGAYVSLNGTNCTGFRTRAEEPLLDVEGDPTNVKGSSFYPNPTDKELTVLLEKPAKVRTPIRLLDQMGKSLIDTHFEVGESKKRLDTEHLMEGLYLLVISDKMDFPYKQKVLIVHKP